MPSEERQTRKDYLVLIIRSVLSLAVMFASVFVCAGRLSYWQGWVLVAVTLCYTVFSFFRLARSPGLIRERMRPGPGVKWWDKLLLAIYGPLSLGLILVAAADAGRFGWTGRLPARVYVVGWAVFFLSYGLVFWAMSANRWFSTVVRIQTDRGQQVVSEGPYRFIRHPGYLGGIGGALATPVVLGSLWGLMVGGAVAIVLIIRTALEDRMLIRELPGYADYAKVTRYRLVPGVW